MDPSFLALEKSPHPPSWSTLASVQSPPQMGVPIIRLVDFPSGLPSSSSVHCGLTQILPLGRVSVQRFPQARPYSLTAAGEQSTPFTQQAPTQTLLSAPYMPGWFSYSLAIYISFDMRHGPGAQESPGEGPFWNFLPKNHFMASPTPISSLFPNSGCFRITFTGLTSGQDLHNFKVIFWDFPVRTRI